MALKFSTEGAGANLSLNFTNSQGNAGGTSIYGPVYWQVEYSTRATPTACSSCRTPCATARRSRC